MFGSEKPVPEQGGKPGLYICASGYVHHGAAGRVECPLCGGHAFSRNDEFLIRWELAHERCCKIRLARAASA